MTWFYEGKELDDFPPKAVGFVYLIISNIDGRMYVGKKLLTKSKAKQVNGKKKKIRVESDWRDYYGSSDEMKELVKTHGRDNFRREILHICYSKSECNYLEAREQFDRRVMETDAYINQWIMFRGRKSQLKLK